MSRDYSQRLFHGRLFARANRNAKNETHYISVCMHRRARQVTLLSTALFLMAAQKTASPPNGRHRIEPREHEAHCLRSSLGQYKYRRATMTRINIERQCAANTARYQRREASAAGHGRTPIKISQSRGKAIFIAKY